MGDLPFEHVRVAARVRGRGGEGEALNTMNALSKHPEDFEQKVTKLTKGRGFVRRRRRFSFPLRCLRSLLFNFLFLLLTSAVLRAEEPPTEWIDPDTGHRVVRLSRDRKSGV